MGTKTIDICDVCGLDLSNTIAVEIAGENIEIQLKGNVKDPKSLSSVGVYAPMNGRVTVLICSACLQSALAPTTSKR